MNQKAKAIIKNRLFWAGLVTVGSAVAGAFGLTMDPADQERLTGVITLIVSVFGG